MENTTKKNVLIFLKNHLAGFLFTVILGVVFLINLKDYIFILKINVTILFLLSPLMVIFVWVWFKSKLDKSNLLASISITFAVFVFLVSSAINDSSKIKSLSYLNNYNCKVAQDILELDKKPNLSSNFTLHHFVIQPYLDNASFIIQQLGTTTGTQLLKSGYAGESANTLLDQIQGLNIQGANPLFAPFIGEPLGMYNAQLMNIASSTSAIFCSQLFR